MKRSNIKKQLLHLVLEFLPKLFTFGQFTEKMNELGISLPNNYIIKSLAKYKVRGNLYLNPKTDELSN